MKGIFGLLAMLYLLAGPMVQLRAENAEPSLEDHREIFEQRFTKFLNCFKFAEAKLQNPAAQGCSENEQTANVVSLGEFSREFPSSRFSDDAAYLENQILFIAAPSHDRIEKFDSFVQQHPGAKLEDYTAQQLLGSQSSLAYLACMSYPEAVHLMRGNLAFDENDYKTAIGELSSIKDKVDYGRDPTRQLEKMVYLPLVIAYGKLGQGDERKAILREAAGKFPDNATFAKLLQKALTGSQ